MGSQQFCLRWNNHQVNMLDVFNNLYSSEALVDVTLACEGVSIKAHKVVLSACSSFFQEIFINNPCKHPVVILKDMKVAELRAVLQFMYRGEVNVSQDQLACLVKTAETLKVKGLAEMNSSQLASLNPAHQESVKNSAEKHHSQTTVSHNSAPHTSAMLNAYHEAEKIVPSDSTGCVDQHDVLTDDNLTDNNPNKINDEKVMMKKEQASVSQSDSHPQLSALLDSAQIKQAPPSPSPSDTADEESYVIEPGYMSHNQSENNYMMTEDDQMGDPHPKVPVLKMSSLTQNSGLNSDISISAQELRLQDPISGMAGIPSSWYQQWRTKRKRYKRYTQETLETAIATVLEGGLSQKRAAVVYGIPHETLRRHVKDRKDMLNGSDTIMYDGSQSNGLDESFSARKDSETSDTLTLEGNNNEGHMNEGNLNDSVQSITIIPDEKVPVQ